MLSTINIYLDISLSIAFCLLLHFCVFTCKFFLLPKCLFYFYYYYYYYFNAVYLLWILWVLFAWKFILFLPLNAIFTGCRIRDWKLFSFIILMTSFHCLLKSIISCWKFSSHIKISHLKGIHVYFALAAFNIFLLSFISAILSYCA